MNENQNPTNTTAPETKFCKECGEKIAKKAVICPHCGCQVENIAEEKATPQIVINNSNQNSQNAATVPAGNAKNKWITFFLWLFLGGIGAHKFYEGKIGMGILYIFTLGLFGIGLIVDFFTILFKPRIYYI